MNIHEYQAKALFEQYGIPVPKGRAACSPQEIDEALAGLPDGIIAVKAQIHAGGRGKGTFTDGLEGGVKLVDKSDAGEVGRRMLGNTLVTLQTGPLGRKVQTVYFTEAVDITAEYYLAILLDRGTSKPVIVASTEGGIDIEEVAVRNPEKITREFIDPATGLEPSQARKVAQSLGFEGGQAEQMVKFLDTLFRLYWEKDATMIEINPLITTPQGQIIALDAKVSFDDNALYRQLEIQELRDLNEEDPKEVEASRNNLSYIALDGNIACMVNGAGLAMSTMDIIKHYGGNPANFLDVGGGANEDQVTQAFKIILSDPKVEGILVNIFGGIMKCDIIAKGIIAAAKNIEITVPIVVRLEGTNVEAGKKHLAESGLPLESADTLSEAAEMIVKLAGAA